jgi:hypothetical protein
METINKDGKTYIEIDENAVSPSYTSSYKLSEILRNGTTSQSRNVTPTTQGPNVTPTYSSINYNDSISPPIGEQPEGNLDSLGKLKEVVDRLCSNIDKLTETLKKTREENIKLKKALESLGVKELEDVLVLTEDMEIK